MANSSQIKGVISYLTKLTHTVDMFRVKFINVTINEMTRHMETRPQINYDLEITPKEDDIPWLWDFFSCKSNHIIQDGCDMVSLDEVHSKLNDIYYNGEKINKWGGYIPDSFVNKISNKIQQRVSDKMESQFFCDNKRRKLTLNVNYELSSMYVDDGITTDVLVYCNQAFVNGKPLEDITQDIAETIVGYMNENDDLRMDLDSIIWGEITNYMSLEDCEIWTHTYTYLVNIAGIEVENSNYVGQSTFSSKLCDFISGD